MAKNNFFLAGEDMPVNKAERNGFASLSKVEVMSLALGGGKNEIVQELLKRTDGYSIREALLTSETDLKEIPGVGKNTAAQIKALGELTRRIEREKVGEKPKLDCAISIYEYMHPIASSLDHEEAWVLLLNHSFRLIKPVRLSSGGLTETAIDVRMVIREAVINNSTAIVLVHNHPSGYMHPSGQDNQITDCVKKACDLMRIVLIDHVIIGNVCSYGKQYYSYHDEGKL